MATTIMSNKKNTSFVVHAAAANSTLVIAGNSSVSNVATGSETLSGAYIAQAVWGCDGAGSINVKRGTTLVAVYDSTGQHDYAGCGIPITVNPTANLVIEFVASANSFIVLELQKMGTTTDYV